MSLPYSKRFLSVSGSSGTVSVSVPAGKVWVIKSAQLLHDSGGTGESAIIRIGAGLVLVSSGYPVLSGSGRSYFDGHCAMTAGETLTFLSFAGTWDAFVSGYELSAVA